MIRCAWIVGVATFCLVFGCVAEAWQTPSAKSPAKASSHAVSINDEDNGKDVDLTSGGTLTVKLKSNPSTGYSWAVAGDPSPLKLEKTSYRRNTSSSKVVGAPGSAGVSVRRQFGGDGDAPAHLPPVLGI